MKISNVYFLMAAVVVAEHSALATTRARLQRNRCVEPRHIGIPKDNFYDYACGGWMKANPLKDEYSRFGTFDQLGEDNREQIRELVLGLDRNAAKKAPTSRK